MVQHYNVYTSYRYSRNDIRITIIQVRANWRIWPDPTGSYFIGPDGLIGPYGLIGPNGVIGLNGIIGPNGITGTDGLIGPNEFIGP